MINKDEIECYACIVTEPGTSKAKSEYISLTASAAAKSIFQCASGPYYRNYYKSGYFYWSPIRIRQCDGLVCRHPEKCIANCTCKTTDGSLYSNIAYRYCFFHGIKLRFTEHLSCKCAKCTSDSDCTWAKKCNQKTWTCQCPAIGIHPHGDRD